MATRRKHTVILKGEEQSELERMLSAGTHSARTLRRAQILLLVASGRQDKDIEAILNVSAVTIGRTTRGFQKERLGILIEKPRCGSPVKLTGDICARITAIASTTPPEGYASWSLRMIAERTVSMGIVGSIANESVRSILKKTLSSRI